MRALFRGLFGVAEQQQRPAQTTEDRSSQKFQSSKEQRVRVFDTIVGLPVSFS